LKPLIGDIPLGLDGRPGAGRGNRRSFYALGAEQISAMRESFADLTTFIAVAPDLKPA
jgi:hypothetical protein